MDNHKEHVYSHIRYGQAMMVDDSLLPRDKRKKPHPTIRRNGFVGLKTFSDYYQALIEKTKIMMDKHLTEHLWQLTT